MRNLLIIFTFFLSILNLNAANNYFHGNVDQNWANPSNWTLGNTPGGDDNAYIQNRDVIIPNGYGAKADKVYIYAGSTLLIENGAYLDVLTLSVSNSLLENKGEIKGKSIGIGSLIGNTPLYGTLINDGAINFKNEIATTLKIYYGDVINNGIISQQFNTGAYNFIRVSAYGQFVNFGIIEKYNRAENFLLNEGLFINEKNGEIHFYKKSNTYPSYVHHPIINNKNTIINKGSIFLNKDGATRFSQGLKMSQNAIFLNEENAYLRIKNADDDPVFMDKYSNFHNYGVVRLEPSNNLNRMIWGAYSNTMEFINYPGSDFNGGGLVNETETLFEQSNINPIGTNHPYGKMTFTGQLEMNASTFNCEIGGTSGGGNANGHDQIHTLKSVNVEEGLINVTLSGGFVPSINDEFILIKTDDQIDGNLDDVNAPNLPAGRKWKLEITSNEIILKVVYASSNYVSQNQNQLSTSKNKINSDQLESKIFPNPFSDLINIDVPSDKFEIYNSLGNRIYQSNSGSTKIDLSTQAAGVYFIHYKENGKLKVEKIIKIK